MPRATHHQSSFLGGEWSPISQGRIDQPAYKTALNVCLNAIPTVEGAFVRRSGTEFLNYTPGRGQSWLLGFQAPNSTPYLIVLTLTGGNGVMTFYSGTQPTFVNDVTTIFNSSSSAGVLTLSPNVSSVSWGVGDRCIISNMGFNGYFYLNRRITLQTISGTPPTITYKDDLGNAFTQDSPINAVATATIGKVLQLSTPYTNYTDYPFIRAVPVEQASVASVVLVQQNYPPQTLTFDPNGVPGGGGSDLNAFSLAATAFVDGPYMDPQPGSATVSAYTGSITVTPLDGTTFTASDVGRMIRLFSQPAAWNSGTTYTYGQTVTYNGQWWSSLAQGSYASLNVNIIPGTIPPLSTGFSVPMWAPAPTAGQWAWGTITAQASTSCTVSLTTPLNSANGSTATTWRLGLYKAGQYPRCGVWHQGRLWLSGAIPNRFDASMSNLPFTFSPTDVNGNVTDDSAIGYSLNSKSLSTIWNMLVDQQGILCFTEGGEFLISASVLNDPLTPTSIQANMISEYKAAKVVPPIRAGMAVAMVHRYGRRAMEFLADAFTGRFTARSLSDYGSHLTSASGSGLEALAYQEEKAPVLWALTFNSQLIGCTYRRLSRFVTENPVFEAWHRHQIADNARLVTSICALPSADNTGDLLYMVTSDNNNGLPAGNYAVEVMRPIGEDA